MDQRQLDHAFLETVESDLARALELATALETELKDDAVEPALAWQDSFNALTANLTGWQDRLETMAGQTREMEQGLAAHEAEMRHWFQSIHISGSTFSEHANGMRIQSFNQ